MSKALGHGEVITIDPSLYFNADDMSVMIHTGDKPTREVRAVPHNDHRAHFACFQLNNPDPATYLCVHITAMVSSGGLLATTVMRVTVKEREWKGPPGDNFVVVPIEGLCSGGNTFADTPRVGYIVLVKNTGEKESESVDQAFITDTFLARISSCWASTPSKNVSADTVEKEPVNPVKETYKR